MLKTGKYCAFDFLSGISSFLPGMRHRASILDKVQDPKIDIGQFP